MMSGDNLRRVMTGPTTNDPSDERLTHLVEAVNRRSETPDRDAISESLLSPAITDEVGGDLAVDDGHVIQSLDEILLALIALADDETHGTGLMKQLSHLFDVELSPGTLYPRLHELDANGTLQRHELVQTKQYSIDETDAAVSAIEQAASQHLALGLFLHASLDAL